MGFSRWENTSNWDFNKQILNWNISKNKFDILRVRRKSVEPVPGLLEQGNISDIVVEDDTAGAD